MINTSMVRILVLSVLPGLVLIIQNGIWLNARNQILNDKLVVKENVIFTLDVSNVIHQIQMERGLTTLYIVSGDASEDYEIESLLQEGYRQTDKALARLSGWIYRDSPAYFKSKTDYWTHLRNYRNSVSDSDFEDTIRFYTSHNAIFIDWMVQIFEQRNNDIWADFVAFQLLMYAKDNIGIERALGVLFYTQGQLRQDTLLWYKASHELARSFLHQFRDHSAVGAKFLDEYMDQDVADNADRLRYNILLNEVHESSIMIGLEWISNMTAYINGLNEVFRAMATHLSQKTDADIRENKIQLYTDITIVILTIIIVPLLNLFVYKLTKKMGTISEQLQEKTINLEKEQQRTESLLSQLIPAKIAKRMQKNSVYPEHFDQVTVMFSDICEFSSLIGNYRPVETIGLVNDVFDILDKSISVHNVSKIGSIGNLLLVGSGIHQRHTDRHAMDIANLALDFLEKVRNLDTPGTCEQKIRLKIGINTGPVVTGVVQGTFPRFCIYGETTACAQMLMMNCLPQRIHISHSTRTALEKNKQFVIRERRDTVTQVSQQETTYWLMEHSLGVINLEVDLDQDDNFKADDSVVG